MIGSNLKIVNFLDVNLNSNDNSYKPFRETNVIPTYINVNSNQPASIVKQIPNAINIRINRLSFKNIFNNLKDICHEAVHNSGYKNDLKYLEANRHHNNGGGNDRRNNRTNKEFLMVPNCNELFLLLLIPEEYSSRCEVLPSPVLSLDGSARCASALEISSGLRGPSPQANTPFGGVGFIAWRLRRPKKGNADGAEGIFGLTGRVWASTLRPGPP